MNSTSRSNNHDNNMCDNVMIIVALFLILSIVYILSYDLLFCHWSMNVHKSKNNKKTNENFGALQSLYSNDGPQDAYLTIENDSNENYDQYEYLRNNTWNIPTRNLGTIVSYPYLYEKNTDMYETLYYL